MDKKSATPVFIAFILIGIISGFTLSNKSFRKQFMASSIENTYLSDYKRSLDRKLGKAILSGELSSIKQLVKKGAHINPKCKKRAVICDSPLDLAIKHTPRSKKLKVIKFLLRNDSFVNRKNTLGKTALSQITKISHKKLRHIIARHLYKNGADPNILDMVGRSPFMNHVATGDSNLVILALKKGAEINLAGKARKKIERSFFKTLFTYVPKPTTGKTPLMLASELGHFSIVKTLVKKGAKIRTMDIAKETAVDYANRIGHLGMVIYLQKQKKKQA